MSYATFYSRKLLGDARYEELKAGVIGAGVNSFVAGLPKSEGGPPSALIEHRVRLSEWQPIAVAAAVFLITFYLFSKR